MAYIRGQERLVYQTVGWYLLEQLDALNWFDTAAPFNAAGPLHLLDYVPAKHEALQPNTLALTQGPELPDEEGEAGCASGGLWITPMVFFIDIYGQDQGTAKALSADVKAILKGRLSGSKRFIPLRDYTQTPVVDADGHWLEFEDVEVETPSDQAYKRSWKVVKVTVNHQYNAAEVGV
ncbi:MAG TPA: hypothetical protein VNA32_10435 [Actinomycetota bacterium]|nr:hypothetical protein [Actinomycetota bacterium]